MKGSIRKRSKTSWELNIDLGRDANGKRLRKFVNVRGKRADADRKLREILSQLDKGIPFGNDKTTVAEFLDNWMTTYVVPNTRPRTAEGYEGIVRNHLKPHLGHVQLAKLQPVDIQSMESSILESGLSARTVQHIHRVLHEALKHAMKWGLIWRNPAEAVDVPKVQPTEIHTPETATILRLIDSAKSTPYYPAYHLMAFTGCRRGEILGLRWEDVDLDRSQISIVQRVKGQGIIFQPPKSSKSRRLIALDEVSVDVLRAHKVQQLEYRLQLGSVWAEYGLVFPGRTGLPLDPPAFSRSWKNLVTKAGFQNIRLHDLRHFHATLLLKEGTHPKVVQERLGHANISVTLDTYSHVVPSMQTEAANVFAAAMAKSATRE
jgi:integrase